MAAPQQHGSMAALFFCLNAVVGAGFLGMPFVLYSGGVLYGLVLVGIIAFLSIAAAEWTIEAMARAESYTSGMENTRREWRIALVSSERKFEVGDLCRLFIHPWFGHIYDAVVTFNVIIILWIYGTLAASSWSSEIPFSGHTFRQCDSDDFLHRLHPDGRCWNAYSVCLLIYGVVVVPLSCLDLHSQVVFQTVMGIFRIVVILSMSIYSLAGAITRNSTELATTGNKTPGEFTQRHIWLHFDFAQWFGVIPVVSFALMVHFMIPTFCQSVGNKKHLRQIFTTALCMATGLYIIVGITVAMYFAADVNETCTLTWLKYTKPHHNIVLRIYSYLLVVFPSIDLCSGYPLLVNVGVNILFSLIKQMKGITLKGSAVKVARFCMATLPLVCSVYVSNLVTVADYAGLFLTIALFIVPALLHFFSKWKSVRYFGVRAVVADSDDPDSEVVEQASNVQVKLFNSASGESMKGGAGAVAPCYKPILGDSAVAVVSLLFGVVAVGASFLSWFGPH
eukprot:m.44402 g.44402  ORF g.44402 m.44402 type:complete len:507 (+) comp33515_c0_seq2:45-1565(+)